jgi:exodeoxyribonuclease VII small subunit
MAMTDERTTFESTHARLDEILVAVRKKDTSLEQSLELLEEGVRLANLCNELIDQTSWKQPAVETATERDGEPSSALEAEADPDVDAEPVEEPLADVPEDDERD